MGIQTITTPAGEEMVVMSRADYDALLAQAADAFEDGADAAAFAAALANQAPEDVMPASVSAAILAGYGRARALREWRTISLDQLAMAVGTTEANLAKVEAGERLLDRELAARLAEALDVPYTWLSA